MKKILFLFLLVSTFVKAQLPTVPGFTNINQKYQWYQGIFHDRLSMPSDTTFTKLGLAEKNFVVYYGNGTWWSRVSGEAIDTTGLLQRRDSTIYYPYWSNPRGYLQASDITQENRLLTGGIVTKVSGLTVNVSPQTDIYSGAVASWPSTNFTLATADATNDRYDAAYTNASGPHIATGTPGNPAVFADIDPNDILLGYILVPATSTDLTTSGVTMIRNEGSGGEWSISKTVTSTDNYGTNPYLTGSISQRVTAATNNQVMQWTAATVLSKATFKSLVIPIRLNATFNQNRNIVVRLMSAAGVQVPGTAAITLAAARNFVKTTLNAYMIVTINMADFGGSDEFQMVEARFTGTGGTVDLQFDRVQLQSDIISAPPAAAQRYGLEDNVYASDRASNLNGFSHRLNNVSKWIIKSKSSDTDSTLVVYNSGGAPIFRVSAVDNTVYLPAATNMGNGTLQVGAGVMVVGGNADITILPNSRIAAFQDQLELKRRYPWSGLNTGKGVTITNDTVGTLGVSDSTLYQALKVTFTNSTNGWQADKFKVFGSGAVQMYNGPTFPGTPTGSIYLGAQGGELKVIDATGNTTTISPHNPMGLPYKLKPLGWTYHSEKNGQFITVDMLKQSETVELLSKEVEELKSEIARLKGLIYKKKKPVKLIYKGKVK